MYPGSVILPEDNELRLIVYCPIVAKLMNRGMVDQDGRHHCHPSHSLVTELQIATFEPWMNLSGCARTLPPQMVEALLKAGAEPDHADRENGMTALMSAAWFEHVSAARGAGRRRCRLRATVHVRGHRSRECTGQEEPSAGQDPREVHAR